MQHFGKWCEKSDQCSKLQSDAHISWHEFFLAGNQDNYQNLVPSMLTYKFWPMNDEAKIFFLKNRSKIGQSKKLSFSAIRPLVFRINWCKMHLYGCQAVRCKLKKGLKTQKKAVLALFWAYVGQPDGHMGWVTLMPLASINPTNPRTNLWNFGENCSAFGGGWKTQFFWVGHFENFFASFPWKQVKVYR